MKKSLAALAFIFALNLAGVSQRCLETAAEIKPRISESTFRTYETKFAEARAQFDKMPNDADAIIWLGRRTGYLGNYKESIRIFTKGIEKFSDDARFYRHRGHRLITLRCFDDAISDFELAVKLIKGKPDEVEPDGLPNAKNIPTSTLQSNIWYHLGLAHYLKGDYKKALKAYKKAENVSKNPDMLVATTHWHYMTLRRLGKTKEAAQLIKLFPAKVEVIENDDYLKLIRLYRGEIKTADFIKSFDDDANTLSNASLGYGWGNWNLYNGEPEDAMRIFRFVTDGNQWASFGYIAAEAEVKRNEPSQ
ncbi:MAG: tetratricopeptide repeat protein [Saprospiraceae bacterium]|nr:tetratricopeptide repeat protein [Pyrinomonadaceae bacterium]